MALAEALDALGRVHYERGAFAEALPHWKRGLAIEEKVLGSEHPYLAASLTNVGFLHKQLGDSAAARPLFERALAIDEKALGLEHPDDGRGCSWEVPLPGDIEALLDCLRAHDRAAPG